MGVIILGGMLSGCAAAPPSRVTADQHDLPNPQVVDGERYASATAGTLAFDPPVIAGQPALDLSRENRGPAAFAGFDSGATTFYDIYTDDRQMSDWSRDGYNDNFYRRAISEKVGVNFR